MTREDQGTSSLSKILQSHQHSRKPVSSIDASASRSAHLPASLGLGSSSDASIRQSINDRSKFYPQSGSSSMAPSRSSDGLRFSPDIAELPRTSSAHANVGSIPTWSSHGSSTRRTPIPGMPVSSQQNSTLSTALPSRNFLVPIGATGARQKLSIANASQRKRLTVSDETQWPSDPAEGRSTDSGPMMRSQSQTEFLARPPKAVLPSVMSRSTSHTGLMSSTEQWDRDNELERVRESNPSTTSTELVQQAAMQRLSSQRIFPQSRHEGSSMFRSNSSNSQRILSEPVAPPQAPAQNQTATASATTTKPTFVDTGILTQRTTSPARPERAAARIFNRTDAQAGSSVKQQTLAKSSELSMLEHKPETSSLSPASATRTALSAPRLDVRLPSSSFFDDDGDTGGGNSTQQLFSSASQATNLESKIVKEQEKRESTLSTSESDRSIGSFEGAYDYDATVPYASLQSSYDEALKIQSRLQQGISGPTPAYRNLFKNDVAEFQTETTPSEFAQKPQSSYLTLSDDDDGATIADAKDSTPRVASRVAQPANGQSGVATTDPRPNDTAPPYVTTDVSTSTNKMVVDDTIFQTVTPPAVSQNALNSVRAQAGKTSLPHSHSFKTLRVSPEETEPKPGPKEEAALEAGAEAAYPGLSPRSMTFQSGIYGADGSIPPTSSSLFNPDPFSREGSRTSPARSPGYPSAYDGHDEIASWQRRQEALAPLSPLQQSRFSEASTIRSDSIVPTRTDDVFSAVGSSNSSDDGLEAESNDGQILPTSAWHELENALRRFRERAPTAFSDRGSILRGVLLPFLALEAETVSVEVLGHGPYTQGKQRRGLFFDWIRFLLLELQHVQTSADRGAILESIACIIESRNFSAPILAGDAEDEARFSSVFGHILAYAIGELNKKGVYQNTLIFSGRLLAVAFFRVRGVASKLLRALPVNRFALERVAAEYGWKKKRPANFVKFADHFPISLRALCYKDARSYLKMLDDEAGHSASIDLAEDDRFLVRQPEVQVEMSGNWLRRWQSDDSELFFSFCRSYHRQLACLFANSRSLKSVSKHFFGGPGYAHLATCVHQKCLALVHRVIMSVTTLSSQKNFNPVGETANVFSGSTAGKPRILEAANRRCTAIVVDIVRAPAGSNMLFAPMLNLHIKVLVKRTSLYDVQGVFCLLDWLDGVLGHMESADLLNQGLVDVSFIISTIASLLETADHALALMRTIAFCYANFGVLTATTENRIAFCEQILLKPAVFNKLFLSWSFTIRAYYLHLLVFRLARIHDFARPPDDHKGVTAVRVVRLFNYRLEGLRNRHDQLSPDLDSSSDGGRSEDAKSRKSGTSTFVSTIKRASSESAGSENIQEAKMKVEKLALTSTKPAAALTPSVAPVLIPVDNKNGSASKTKTWLKSLRAGGKPAPRPDTDSSRKATARPSEASNGSTGTGSNKSTPRTSFESTSDTMSDASTLAGSIRTPKGDRNSSYEFDFKQQQQQQRTPPKPQSSPKVLQPQHTKPSATDPDATAPAGGLDRPTKSRPPALVIGQDAGTDTDTVFDLQSTQPQLPTPGHVPDSPRISRAFSRRASMLPSVASALVASVGEDLPPLPGDPSAYYKMGAAEAKMAEKVYADSLHVYAVQSLREYEQTVQEHDDFFAALPKDQIAQVPKLPVTWPAMWSSTGE